MFIGPSLSIIVWAIRPFVESVHSGSFFTMCVACTRGEKLVWAAKVLLSWWLLRLTTLQLQLLPPVHVIAAAAAATVATAATAAASRGQLVSVGLANYCQDTHKTQAACYADQANRYASIQGVSVSIMLQ